MFSFRGEKQKMMTKMQKIGDTVKRYRRLLQKGIFAILPNGYSRANFLRKRNLLRSIGSNVYFYSRIMPADSRLLKIGSNVAVATNVRFLGHDATNVVLTGMYGNKYGKWQSCIEVGSNVFIGADSIILPDVKIGDNSIIGAGAVVTKDLPSGFVWGGYLPGSWDGLTSSLRKEKPA